jgi:hypothetical protein
MVVGTVVHPRSGQILFLLFYLSESLACFSLGTTLLSRHIEFDLEYLARVIPVE